MLDPTAQERRGCYHSTSPGPTISEAEDVVPAGTHTRNTHTHCVYTYIRCQPHRSQTLRALAQTQTAPMASSCFSLWLDRVEVHWRDYIYIYEKGGSFQRLRHLACSIAGPWIPYELLRLQPYSSCWCRPSHTQTHTQCVHSHL